MLLEVTDREKLQKLAAERKKSGQTFIICPNHQSFLDPFVLCSTYPFEVFANIFHVGASEFFRSRLMSF
ncbi:1-acyl-sn-glycerol-3-phosphate acyltransferase, partial [Escherichia coli]|nr:1-acyl-sn-glycerol-3-phosphate acyltransferase [Escherichia coli]